MKSPDPERQEHNFFDAEACRSIIEASPDGIIVCDEDGVIIYVNPTMEGMSGYRSSEMIGK